jgi:hypothetical protein
VQLKMPEQARAALSTAANGIETIEAIHQLLLI